MLNKIFSLPVVEQISPYISQRNIDDFPLIVVSHPKARGVVSIQGAHLITWQPSGEKPVLWVSEKTAFSTGTAIRGGIPSVGPGLGRLPLPVTDLPEYCPGNSKHILKMRTGLC